MSTDNSIRLNKFISDSGFCSRREADQYIEEGRVTINNRDARKGATVKPGDKVAVDGEPIKAKKPSDRPIYLAFNKPTGITTTTDSKDKKNIIDFIGFPKRIFPIGRLDNASEGLIFLTNDGDIVNKILRADNNHEKEYVVMVDKPVTEEFIRQMSNGVRLFEGMTKKCFVQQQGHKVFRLVLTQGWNRQIRRMCEALGYKVEKLKRVRIMSVKLDDLPTGHWRYLTLEEIKSINELVAGSSKTEEASSKARESSKAVKKTADEEYEDLLTDEEFGVKVHSVKKSAPKEPREAPLRDPKLRRAERFSKPKADGDGPAKADQASTGKPMRKTKPASGKNLKTKSEHVSKKTDRSPKGSLAPRNAKPGAGRKPKPGGSEGSKRTAGTRGKGRR
ncbi:23S rRNA pseudouridine(2604) synthase RluF [Rufibacter glacialis]|uniref:Pseudouridine synthase n=1 Tax=Rufibacter glacialis TaxID=1259555 RepID=A0A5M8Q776_9BACT|nr:23S rRNA pseudouridine(2604) synthase RluF [Rufibacter glacialis]KAA6430680.1 23S rRNA pseudouridine(2604) synthase RluF [Rufibacter glacialis]GGK85763.1 pseudouridine synthase [Rufibacter glacialis]